MSGPSVENRQTAAGIWAKSGYSKRGAMSETRKLAAILVADVVGYSRLAGADEDRTLARLRALRSDLIDPTIAVHHGRVVKRTGDGSLIEFRSVVDAVRCAIEVQNGLIERNAGLPPERRIEFRVGIHLGDVVEESDGDLMGDGVNIAARLEGIAAPGAICLSEDAYRQVSGRLDMAVTDLGPIQLKNIERSIRVYSLQVGVPAQAKPVTEPKAPEERPRPKPRAAFLPLIAGMVALIVVVGGSWYFLAGNRPAPVVATAPASAEAAHLSLVVLPFANLSGDPAQDYFADGITENLTTDLSRIRNSFVIARNTAFTYKGKSVDAKEIGKELGVRYVLEGSVQRDQSRVRVNAQLVDAETGAHLWAERFEEDVADLFKLQDQVVARLANTLGIELVRAEAQRGARTGNPDAIALTMRGWALVRTLPQTLEKAVAARALFEQALKIDPNDADALAGIAYAHLIERGYATNPGADYDIGHLGLDGVGDTKGLLESEMRDHHIKWITSARIKKVEKGKMTIEEVGDDGAVKATRELPFGFSMILPAFRSIAPLRGIEGLVNPRGFVIVDKHQQNPAYPNVFSVGVCVAIPPVGPSPVPCGVPKTGFMIESMVTATARNIGQILRGKESMFQATWNAVCLADFGDGGVAFVAQPQIPPRNVNWSSSGKWVHAAKIGYEKYFIRKMRKGESEPFYESMALNMLGIEKLKAVKAD